MGLCGIVHSMAHKTGAIFEDLGAHIIHGAANAMYLPKVIAFNAKDETAKKCYGVIADYMGLGGANDDEKVANLIAYLRGMNDALNIPQCIKNYGLDAIPAKTALFPRRSSLKDFPRSQRTQLQMLAQALTPEQSLFLRWKSFSSAATTIQKLIFDRIAVL